MTDTVNVPREDWGEYKRSQIAHLRPYIIGETLSERVSISMADLEAGSPKEGDMIARNPANHEDQWLVASDYFAANFEPAMLAAAPKAEPVSDPYKLECPPREPTQSMMDALLYHSSHDTTHSDAYTMWTSAHDAWMRDDAQPLSNPQQLPEAPKVEQEPVAWRGRISETSSIWDYRNFDMTGEIWPIVEPLYTHPAPASDELLEAAVGLRAAQRAYMADRGNEALGKAVGVAAERLDRAIAKHKGPQS